MPDLRHPGGALADRPGQRRLFGVESIHDLLDRQERSDRAAMRRDRQTSLVPPANAVASLAQLFVIHNRLRRR